MSTTSLDRLAPVPPPTPRHPARDGCAAVLPIAIGYVPFALVIGTAIAEHHAGVAGWSGSWLIYGGSAHLAVIQVLDTSGATIAVLTGLLVNARMLVYSASLSARWSDQPRWFRLVAAALVIDPTWALAMQRRPTTPRAERQFFFAAGLVLGLLWSTAMAIGATVGGRLHLDGLEVVAPLCLVALVAPRLSKREERPTMAAAAIVAVLGRQRPAGTGLLAAMVAGCIVGELVERRVTEGEDR